MILSYHDLIEAALTIEAGDTHAANRWLLELAAVLQAKNLAPAQRSYLYRLRRVWRQRAQGLDARWNDYGSAPGNKPRRWPIVKPVTKAPVVAPVSAPVQPTPVLKNAEQPQKPNAAERLNDPPVPVKPGLTSLLEKYGR